MINDYGLILIFTLFMGVLALKDWISFKRGEHIDYTSMIVSTGVLGTFLGIVVGLWNFDTTDISGSVPLLLEGLKLAFITSIIGMGLSILLEIFQAQPEEKPKEDSKDDLKQPLDKINQSLETLIKQPKQDLKPSLDKINQSLATLISLVDELKKISQRDYRFSKLDAKGEILPEEATKWAAIQDNETGFIWEYKEGQDKYKQDKISEYVNAKNQQELAGSKNWRVPSVEELQSLIKAGNDKRYFPNSQKGLYYSSTSNKNDEPCCLNLETGRSFYGIGKAQLLLII